MGYVKGYLGHTVINGQLKYASVSGVKLFDPRTRGGCPRRWHHRYVGGHREPETDNMREAREAGIALDKEMKHYLLTGEKNLSALAIKGLHIMEQPGPGLSVDVMIHSLSYFLNGQPFAPLPDNPDGSQPKYPEGVQVVVNSALTAGGIPFVGELDIVHSRGHYRDDDGQFYDDPPDTIEVADLKYKSNAKDREGNSHLLLPTDLVRDIQMAGYGEWVARVRPHIKNVRLSHLYFPKRPAKMLPTKVTRLHVVDECRRTWEYVDGLVRYMADVAKERDIEKVPGADRFMSCDAYSGCPHRETCSHYKSTSLDSLFEQKVVADHMQEKNNMGVIAATQPQMMQQLAQEEDRLRGQVAQQQAQMPVALNYTELLQVCQRLGSYGFGMPSLAGNAAVAYAAAGGQNVAPGFVYQGIIAPPGAQYSLHGVTCNEVQQIYKLERDAAARAGVQQPAPSQFPPVQMPASTPPLTQAIANAYNATVAGAASAVPSFLPPGAPESMPQLAQAQTAFTQQEATAQAPATAQAATTAPAEEPKKKGRPKKHATDSGTAPEATAAVAAPPPPPSSVGVPAPQVTPVAAPTFPVGLESGVAMRVRNELTCSVLINARFNGRETKSLAGYVDYINAQLSKRYSVLADGTPGIQDVRCAPKDSPLAFGGWKGAVREVVKADPPQVGDYHLDTHMDELNEVVADALRVVAEQNGWLYVRSVR